MEDQSRRCPLTPIPSQALSFIKVWNFYNVIYRLRPVRSLLYFQHEVIFQPLSVALPPAFAFSDLPYPPGISVFLTVDLLAINFARTIGVYHVSYVVPSFGWVPSIPRWERCSSLSKPRQSLTRPIYHFG